jgi:nucleoid-associated protein YgaU
VKAGAGAVVRLAVWTAGLVVVARALLTVGAGSSSIPLASPDELSAWVSDTPPADMAVAVVRLAALAATFYLLGVTALAVVARLTRLGRLALAVDRISPRIVRRVARGGYGLGLVLGGAVGALPAPDLGVPAGPSTVASSGPAPSSVASMVREPGGTATMTRATGPAGSGAAVEVTLPEATMTRVDPAPPPSATMTRLDPDPAATATTAPAAPAATPASLGPTRPGVANARPLGAEPTLPAMPLPQVDGGTWVVEPGDSFWSIAEDVLSSTDGAARDERAVARYWRRLVAANRADLVDPDNADLLIPGQRLVVPPPAG